MTKKRQWRAIWSDGIVETSEGKYPVYFIDPIRLQQDLTAETELGTPFLAEPGLIILPEVTREGMENAVRQLWEQGYFESLKSLKAEAQKEAIGHGWCLIRERSPDKNSCTEVRSHASLIGRQNPLS